MKRIVFHIEGGASKADDGKFRQAFRTFFGEIESRAAEHRVTLQFIMEGSRRETYDRFCYEASREPDEYHVLLIDSEDPVMAAGLCWRHLEEREADRFQRPAHAEEQQCQLMVQAMESWFFADIDALANYYGKDFKSSSLPKTRNVEDIPRARHISSLEAATKPTQKERYHKTKHAPDILALIDPSKVRPRAPHCDRIFIGLIARLG